jgi:hypothetical protein
MLYFVKQKNIVMHRSKTHLYRETKVSIAYLACSIIWEDQKRIFFCEKLVLQKSGLWRPMGKFHSDIRNQHS